MKKMLYLCYLLALNSGATFCMERTVPCAIKNYQKPQSKVNQLMPPATQRSLKNDNNRGRKGKNSKKKFSLLKKREKEEVDQELEEDEVAKHNEEEYEALDRLIAAVSSEDIAQISRCLTKNEVDINRVNNEGKTALVYAIFTGNYKIVQCLIESGAQPDPKNSNPLQVAHLLKNEQIINLLMQKREFEYTHATVQNVRKKHRCDCEACNQVLIQENKLSSSARMPLFDLDRGMNPWEVCVERDRIRQKQLEESARRSQEAAKNRKQKGYEPVIGVDDREGRGFPRRENNSSPDDAPKPSILDLFDSLMNKPLFK